MVNTHIPGPTAVNEVRLNFTRSVYAGNSAANGLGKVSTWGFVEGGSGHLPLAPPACRSSRNQPGRERLSALGEIQRRSAGRKTLTRPSTPSPQF